MENVKEYINRISEINSITVDTGSEKDKYINEYLEKMNNLAKRKNRNIDIDFLKENLDRNVQYLVGVNYSDEKLFSNMEFTSGYGKDFVDKNAELKGSSEELADLMEICTESIACMMNFIMIYHHKKYNTKVEE